MNEVSTAVGLADVPDAIRAAVTIAEPDYADTVMVATGVTEDVSPEVWARTVLERTSTGRSAPTLWRLLGLRLGPRPSTDHVQGWRIAGRGSDWIRLEVTSWMMTAEAVVHVADGKVSLSLFVRYDQPVAAFIWPPVSVMHRRVVPVMIHQAERVLASHRR